MTGFSASGIPPDSLAALGVDAGPHTGMFAGWWNRETWELAYALAFECSAAMAPVMLRVLCRHANPRLAVAQLEAFVMRGKSARLRGANAAGIQAEITELSVILHDYGIPVVTRPAVTAKKWATNRRLDDAGLLKLAGTSEHVRDAGRHMLFAACQAGLPDPLKLAAG